MTQREDEPARIVNSVRKRAEQRRFAELQRRWLSSRYGRTAQPPQRRRPRDFKP